MHKFYALRWLKFVLKPFLTSNAFFLIISEISDLSHLQRGLGL